MLQYGVTRERLREVLRERDGWDVLHISGHRLPAGLLLERADGLAADPNVLEERLGEADEAWLASSVRLEAFSEHRESTVTEEDFLRVLSGWTRATVEALPDASAVLFQFLCPGGVRPARRHFRCCLDSPVAQAAAARRPA